MGKLEEFLYYLPLIKFMWPLIITQMAPDIAEQALNRGITSLANKEMVELLAVFGLAFYYVKLLTGSATELRQITIVLVKSKVDYRKMLWLSISVGIGASLLLLITGVTPLGSMLYEDVHLLSKDVSDSTKEVIVYLCLIPVLEAVAKYHEGALIAKKLTILAGASTLTDFGLQVVFTICLLFTPTRTDPVLIPIFSLYAGYIGRLILCTGFFYVYVYRNLRDRHAEGTEQPVTVRKGLCFWWPLGLVLMTQFLTRPLINLTVARDQAAEGQSVKAVAVLSAMYPVNRVSFSWLNELRTIVPTFSKPSKACDHAYTPRQLASFSAACTVFMLVASLLIFWVPGSAYTIMLKVTGLNSDLAEACVLPLQIASFICVSVGLRAHVTSWLMSKKKTTVLAPSALTRTGLLVAALFVLPAAGFKGAPMGATCLLFGFCVESVAVLTGTGVIVLLERRKEKKKARSSATCQGADL